MFLSLRKYWDRVKISNFSKLHHIEYFSLPFYKGITQRGSQRRPQGWTLRVPHPWDLLRLLPGCSMLILWPLRTPNQAGMFPRREKHFFWPTPRGTALNPLKESVNGGKRASEAPMWGNFEKFEILTAYAVLILSEARKHFLNIPQLFFRGRSIKNHHCRARKWSFEKSIKIAIWACTEVHSNVLLEVSLG